MDERFVAELIEDMEHMGRLLERCVRRLRSQVSTDMPSPGAGAVVESPRLSGTRDDIRVEIEKQRRAIMAQVDQVKAQALQAASAAKGGASGLGAMAGLAGMPGLPGLDAFGAEALEELRRKLAEKTEKVEKPEEDET